MNPKPARLEVHNADDFDPVRKLGTAPICVKVQREPRKRGTVSRTQGALIEPWPWS